MTKRTFQLDEKRVVLPKGTRVVLRIDLTGEDGYRHKTASLAVVRDVIHNTYHLETPSGRRLSAQRDQLTPQRHDLLADLGQRQWDYRRVEDQVIYAAVVGSQAWGLANASSDEDIRGCFVAPFEDTAGLWDMPGTVQDPSGEVAYWEVGKFVEQGLRGDANTLETLWSPLHKQVTRLGEELLSRRQLFVSMNILGSFGRYAQSQFKKIERSLERDNAVRGLIDEIDRGRIADVGAALNFFQRLAPDLSEPEARKTLQSVCRSLFDRGLLNGANFAELSRAVVAGRAAQLAPPPYRPKNAYNLLRLLHSCIHWLQTGKPLIQVEGPLRTRLLQIKEQEVPVAEVVQEAKSISDTLDAEAETTMLPERPDYEAADAFLKMCRREQARRVFGLPSGVNRGSHHQRHHLPDGWTPELVPDALPTDIDVPALKRFLRRYIDVSSSDYVPVLWVGLTGAHAYGFPSPDSDIDLKGVFVASANQLLGLQPPKTSIDFLDDWEGRETDLTLNELGAVASLLLSGNGNIVERLLGPLQVLTTPLGHQLAELARGALSQRVSRHYMGFFRGMRRESEVEATAGGRTAKRLLYAYRVSLTGVHLLQTGEVVTDLRPLAEQYGFTQVADLIRVKEQAEKQTVSEPDAAPFLQDFDTLEALLEEAVNASVLPVEPQNRTQLDHFVVTQRLDLMS